MAGKRSKMVCSWLWLLRVKGYAVREITVLCYIHKNDLMSVIICKSYKHLVTLYNVMFLKYDRHTVILELYRLLTEEGSNVLLKRNVLGNISV